MNSFYYYSLNTAKNLVMSLFPRLVIRLRRPTGTGLAEKDTDLQTSLAYSRGVFKKYLRFLDAGDTASFLEGKTIVEIGPGDTLTVALLFLAYGARRVVCIDRFPLVQNLRKNSALAALLQEALPTEQRANLQKIVSFDGSGVMKWDAKRLTYLSSNKGSLSFNGESADLVVSNAALEHVRGLEGMFRAMNRTMRSGGMMVHAVDLGPHQLARENPLDFLLVPDWLWTLMTSHRGAPNRARKPEYEKLLKENAFEVAKMKVTEWFDPEDVHEIRRKSSALREAFSEEDLSCRSLLFSARKI